MSTSRNIEAREMGLTRTNGDVALEFDILTDDGFGMDRELVTSRIF